MTFDLPLYKRVHKNPLDYGLYAEMSLALETMIQDAAPEYLPRLCYCRSPVTIAKMEYQNAIKAGITNGKAFYMAVVAYEDRRDDFIVRSQFDEVLYQADKKRERGERLTAEELAEEMDAFISKRGRV